MQISAVASWSLLERVWSVSWRMAGVVKRAGVGGVSGSGGVVMVVVDMSWL